jgi:phage-related protein
MGAVLLPLVDKIMTAFAEALPVILDWASAFGRYVGPVLKKVIGWVKQFIDQFQQSGKQTQSTRDDIIGSLQDILGVVRVVVKIIEFLWAHFGSTLMTYVVGTFKNIITIIEAALKIIHGVLDIVMGLLTGDWSRAWQGVKEVLSGVWTIIKTLIRQAMLYIRTLLKIGWKAIKLIFTAAMKGIWALIKWYFRTWVRMFLALPKLLAKALAALAPLLGQVFRAAWARASQWVQQGITNVVNAVRALPGKIRALGGLLAAAGRAVIQAFVNGLQNAPGVVSNIAGNVWDALKSLVNSAIDKINGALDFTISLPGPDVHINAGHIPHLARGARATSGTLAMIGEGREPETVLPDSMLSGLLGRAAAAGGANRLRLVVDGWEFNAYVDARADGRVSTAGNLAAEGRRASWPSRR